MIQVALIPVLLMGLADPAADRPSLTEVAGYYTFDRSHVSVAFSVRHLGLARVRGTFPDVVGTIRYDPSDLEASSVTAIIRTASVSTGNERRDADLRDNFLAVDEHPTIRFQSTAIRREGEGGWIRGVLTIRGVSREVEMPLIRLGSLTDARTGTARIGFATELSVHRHDFGVERGTPVMEAIPVVGDSIRIEIELEATRVDPAALGWDARTAPSIGALLFELDTPDPAAYRARFQAAKSEAPEAYNFSVRELVVLGMKLLDSGRSAAAVEVLRLAVETDPASALAMETLGLAQAEAGRAGEATLTLRAVLQIDPERTTAIEALRAVERAGAS
jgi:polyisoprenoid-binding protein YceI